ncbi:MAG: EscN/YscN/HrcN family type III secretion system ATPase [Planctomycetes bacterium]|nr:EscN/YscN/HrcN family type III secretion system ATPase [Planctomycetota bacterium]
MVEATGLRAAQGELCRIDRGELGSMEAEVVGFRGQTTLLMPHGDLAGIAPSQVVTALGRPFSIPVGSSLLGRVVDGFGQPLDGGQPIEAEAESAVRAAAPAPLTRSPIVDVLQTGVRAIDATTTIGRGQRLGIFSGSGVGKSSLLGQITRGTDADIIVCALVGERGREVRHFAEEVLAARGKDKTVMVVATSDRSPIERYLAPFVAVTIAEHFRDRGQNVLLLMDSVTRFAGACREIGLAAGEPPTVRGYPPSFFATVPKLIERMGAGEQGSITGLLTVLLDGDDPNEPVADTLRGLLDGHLLLSRDLAQAGHFPAIDVLKSLSRLMPSLASPDHLELAHLLRSCLAAYEEGRDLVEIGAYKSGANPRLDRAIQLLPAIQAFLQQTADETSALPETLELLALLRGALPQV